MRALSRTPHTGDKTTGRDSATLSSPVRPSLATATAILTSCRAFNTTSTAKLARRQSSSFARPSKISSPNVPTWHLASSDSPSTTASSRQEPFSPRSRFTSFLSWSAGNDNSGGRVTVALVCIQGCDASVLLDSREGAPSEKEASANKNSLRGFDVIDAVKERLEHLCPLTVSCADIVALSARDAIFLTGGPFYPLSTGRRDGRVSRAATAEAQLPSPFDTLAAILAAFNERGLHQNDTITLLGAHTIGHTHCRFVQSRLYNFSGDGAPDPTMNSTLAESLKLICPEDDDEEADMDGRTKLPMDFGGYDTFDSHFYQNVVEGYGVLYADQQLMASAATANLVVDYAIDTDLFRREFARAMVKLSSVGVLTGSQGEVRRDCRRLLEGEPTGLNGG
ncbi:Peroxidase 10 [Nymphaea thermarum]|nr:Peroxidase 10 [Nymphaea thermarum]